MNSEEFNTWKCGKCTFINAATRNCCDICFLSRDTPPDTAWQCGSCRAFSPKDKTHCSRCGLPGAGRFPATDRWRHYEVMAEPRRKDSPWDWSCQRLGLQSDFISDIESSTNLPADDLVEDTGFIKKNSCAWRCMSCDMSLTDSDRVFSAFSCPDCRGDRSPELPPSSKPSLHRTTSRDTASGRLTNWEEISNKEIYSAPLSSVPDRSSQDLYERGSKEDYEIPEKKENIVNCKSSRRESLTKHYDGHSETDSQPGGYQSGLRPFGSAYHRTDVPEDRIRIRFPDTECRLVLLGKTGSGKSATANTIVGFRRFETGRGFRSTTKQCQRFSQRRFGLHVEVVDTPGLFDTDLDNETIIKEIIKCIGVVSPGPHALIMVLRIGIRFTEEEVKCLELLRVIFGSELLKYLVLVFTHGDRLADPEHEGLSENEAVRNMLDNSPDKLKELVKGANNRYIVFNNKGTPQQKANQVKDLLLSVRQVLQFNGGKPYTNCFLEKAEQIIQERETILVSQLPEIPMTRRGNRRNSSKELERKRLARDFVRDELVQESPVLKNIKKALHKAFKVFFMNSAPRQGQRCCIL